VTAARPSAGVVALTLITSASFTLVCRTASLLAAGPEAPPQRSLHVNLAASQELPSVITGALVAEANAIWWTCNLRLVWRTADVSDPLPAMPDSEDWLRVLVLARQVPESGKALTFAVGELVRHEGARPLAIASLTAARRVVDESLRSSALEDPHDYDRRLGVVLGRAVAHEIGHYLLRTSTHATDGLMRARIDAREFADVRSQSFRLDPAARARLAPSTTRR
jgi:hypothetical protein